VRRHYVKEAESSFAGSSVVPRTSPGLYCGKYVPHPFLSGRKSMKSRREKKRNAKNKKGKKENGT
jgi:hypothetical protein